MANRNISLADKRALAHDLYMRTDKTQKEIAELVNVSAETIGEWVRKNKWKELKAANSVTRAQVINNTLLQIKELQDDVNQRERKYPTPAESDIMIKLSNLIRDMDKSLSLPDYITVVTELLRHISDAKPALAKEVADVLNDFVQTKARAITQ